MRGKIAFATICAVLLAGASSVSATTNETEQEIVNRYLRKTQAKHTRKISWIATNFTMNRINRDNDYNKFADYNTQHFSNVTLPWIGEAGSFGVDLGMMLGEKFAWSLGGEYWLKMGVNKSGEFTYSPPQGGTVTVENLVSQVQVWGVTSSLQFYALNPPNKSNLLDRFALRLGVGVGFYQSSWDLWDNYQNLNLATSAPASTNTTYKGSAPSFSVNLGVDYPLPFFDMCVGFDVSYLYLNFTNVAWYNTDDQEIVATYSESPESRVDLNFSGIRGKFEVKRFFKI